jgi:hypothetical protein
VPGRAQPNTNLDEAFVGPNNPAASSSFAIGQCMRDFARCVLAAASVMALLSRGDAAAAGPAVDLELIIGVDISTSMDEGELRVQRDGYVQAFRSAEIVRAIGGGLNGRIAVTYFEWAGENAQRVIVPRTVIDGSEASASFADKLSQSELTTANSLGTSISAAVLFASSLFDLSGAPTPRRAIDISGDGPNSRGPQMLVARNLVLLTGITINGLPVMLPGHDPSGAEDLGEYYRQCVIGGPGAFVVPVTSLDDFQSAIRRKLVLEIAGLPGPQVPILLPAASVDCVHGLAIP